MLWFDCELDHLPRTIDVPYNSTDVKETHT